MEEGGVETVVLPPTKETKDLKNDVCRKNSNSSKNSSCPPAVAETAVKRKPKMSKDISLMMKALNTLESPEEKIAALCKKYSDLLQDYQVAQKQLDLSHKKETQMQKEIARGQNDKRKMTLANSRLENLARELQKRNMSEEAKVRDMAEKLRSSLTDAESQMRKAVESNDRLSSDYGKIKKEFEDLAGKNKIRDKKIENVIEQYKLELKLMTVEHKKYVLELERDLEFEKMQRKAVTQKLKEQHEAFEIQQKLVSSLQEQTKFYDTKFREFQSMLQRSRDTCESLATQHDKMKKRLNSMESERQTLRHKLEQKNKQATEAIKQNEKSASKQTRLEKLCRALQNERNDLVQQLRELELQLSLTSSPSSSNQASTTASSTTKSVRDSNTTTCQTESSTNSQVDNNEEILTTPSPQPSVEASTSANTSSPPPPVPTNQDDNEQLQSSEPQEPISMETTDEQLPPTAETPQNNPVPEVTEEVQLSPESPQVESVNHNDEAEKKVESGDADDTNASTEGNDEKNCKVEAEQSESKTPSLDIIEGEKTEEDSTEKIETNNNNNTEEKV